MDGIKRLAKTISAEQGIKHTEALDQSARAAGFQNFRHARNAIGIGPRDEPVAGHLIYITMYWQSRQKGLRGPGGRETLTIWLSSPWADLITAAQFGNNRWLMRFRPAGADHLESRSVAESQYAARRDVCALARTLQFMDASKLRPSKGHAKGYPGGRSINAAPGEDHSSLWYEPASGRYLIADEPYEPAAVSQRAEREAWAARHGHVIAKPEWPGMYNPGGGSRLYLISDASKGIPLGPVIEALNRLPHPIFLETWNGESGSFSPIFVSPGALAKVNSPTVTQKPEHNAAGGPRNSVGYVQTLVGLRRRPKGCMPIDAHKEVGTLIKSVLIASSHRKGVYNRLNSLRSKLDEWVQREYNSEELPHEQFFDLYYHESNHRYMRSMPAGERNVHLNKMARVKSILVKHYPDCPPLRAILKKIDGAAQSMQSWTS